MSDTIAAHRNPLGVTARQVTDPDQDENYTSITAWVIDLQGSAYKGATGNLWVETALGSRNASVGDYIVLDRGSWYVWNETTFSELYTRNEDVTTPAAATAPDPLRITALHLAVEHGGGLIIEADADEVVKVARKYHQFLSGDSSEVTA
jgi:hypothetical protein